MDDPKRALFPVASGGKENSNQSLNDPYAVVRYTVDFFSDTQKTLGEDKLSAVLGELRAIIESDCIRREQILRARPDGLDILVLFPGYRRFDGRMGEWIRRFRKVLCLFGVPDSVSLSVGVSGAADALGPACLAECAEQAEFARLYGRLERNPFVRYYAEEDYRAMRRQRRMETQIYSAWKEDQLQIYLQPQYALDGLKIVGAEALVRWNHPEYGLVMPDEFIPLLEKNHCIMQLDFWMLEECCRILQRWKANGYCSVPLSINFSRIDAIKENFVQHFVAITKRYGVTPDQICLEWTESAFSSRDRRVIQIARQLHEKGYSIAMDDFGTGYSSLNILTELPIDVIKWDRKFLDFRQDDRQRRFLLSQMMRISKDLKYTVIAEGVEYQWQAAMLRNMGCKYVQGFLFGKPIPWEACEKAIRMGG